MTVTKSCSLFFSKKILSLYCSPTENENWLANAAHTIDGSAKVSARPAAKKHSTEIFKRFLVQSMPPHLSVQRLVVDLRLNCRQGNSAFVFNQQVPEILLFASEKPLF